MLYLVLQPNNTGFVVQFAIDERCWRRDLWEWETVLTSLNISVLGVFSIVPHIWRLVLVIVLGDAVWLAKLWNTMAKSEPYIKSNPLSGC